MSIIYELQTSNRFKRELDKFVKKNKRRSEAVKKALKLLVNNPKSPGLNIEKIANGVWTIRIDKGNRIFLTLLNKQKILLIDIGTHDKYRNY